MITYKEFEKQVNALGYTVLVDGTWLRVLKRFESVYSQTEHYINISMKFINSMDSVNRNVKSNELFELCVKLASTPIKDREEVQLYYLLLDIDHRVNITHEWKFINLDRESGRISLADKQESIYTKTKFTLEEVKEMNMIGFRKVKVE